MPLLLLGIIGKTKAAFAGRVGPPLLQPYFDVIKLLRKGSVFSRTTTWVFKAGPVVGLVTALFAAVLIPLGGHLAPVSFEGDLVLFAYLFGLGRFFTVAAALDTGSAFEGMWGAREVTFSCLTEPALFFGLIVLTRLSGSLSLSTMIGPGLGQAWHHGGASLVLECGRDGAAWSGAAPSGPPAARLLRGMRARATSTHGSRTCSPVFTVAALGED